jgi:MFS family permease
MGKMVSAEMAGSQEPSLWRLPAMQALVATSLMGFVSFCITLAALPIWAVAGGASHLSAGLVTTAMLTCTVLTQMAVPTIAARLGLARTFGVGLLAMGLPSLLYLFDQEVWWLIVVSAIRGAGFAIVTVVGATMTARISPPGRRGEAVGVYSFSSSLPNMLAVPAGAGLTLSGHFSLVAILAAAPIIAVPLVRRLRAGSVENNGDAGDSGDLSSARHAVIAAVGPGVILLIAASATSGLVTFLPIERPEGSVATVSLLLLGVTAVVTRWRTGALADRIGSRMLLLLGLCLCAAGLVAVAAGLVLDGQAEADILVLLGCAVFGVGWGGVQNLTLVVAFQRTNSERAATASAIWNAAFDTGLGLGAVGVGALAESQLRLPWTYLFCALLVTLCLPVVLIVTQKRSRTRA